MVTCALNEIRDATSLLRTKVILPHRPPHLLPRQRLHDHLQAVEHYPLTLVVAPPGYGKTSALVDWAHDTHLPICWYALDALDQEPQQFLAYLVAALAQRFPALDTFSLPLSQFNAQATDVQHLVTVLVNEIVAQISEPFVLVLDDVHEVGACDVIRAFLNAFAQRAPAQCHLVLASRTHVDLPDLALMAARSQVLAIDAEALAFRPAEIQALLLHRHKLTVSEAQAAALAQETEGWITGLLLSARTHNVRHTRVTGMGIYDYLAHQVLDQQPPSLRDFLLRTALLETFDADLCTRILGSGEDWRALMADVTHRNLFVLPVGQEGAWLRYHRLFQDFLQRRMQEEQPEAYAALLRRLAHDYTERRLWDHAYAVYQRLADEAATVNLIKEAGSPLIKAGRLGLLRAWLDTLPAKVLHAEPRLLSLLGVVRTAQGAVKEGYALQSRALVGLPQDAAPGARARCLLRRAVDGRMLGQYDDALADCEAALTIVAPVSEAQPDILAEARRLKAITLYDAGCLNAAETWSQQALAACIQAEDDDLTALVQVEAGLIAMQAGHYAPARRHYQQALAHWQADHNLIRQATLLNNLGVLHHLTGDYEQAALALNQALAGARRSDYAHGEALTLTSLGDLYADLLATGAARGAYREAAAVAGRIDRRFLLLYLHLAEAALARRQDDVHLAREHVARAGRLVTPDSPPYEQGLWHAGAGRQACREGDGTAAIPHLEAAAALFEAGGHRRESAQALLTLAAAQVSAGNLDAARERLAQAFTLAAALESDCTLLAVEPSVVKVLDELQDTTPLGRRVAHWCEQVARWQQRRPALRRHLRALPLAFPLSAPRFHIQALGAAQVTIDGEPVSHGAWQWLAARDLLFCLLANPQGLTKGDVGTELWSNKTSDQVNAGFKKAMQYLRRVMGSEAVRFEDDRYTFNQALDYDYDVETFQAKIAQAEHVQDPQTWIPLLKDAIARYTGPYLPKCDGAWVAGKQHRLQQSYTQAVLRLATHYLETQQYEVAVTYAHRLLREDAAVEPVHVLLMRAYAALGDHASVARQYRHCVETLDKELDVPPSPQTQALYRQLIR